VAVGIPGECLLRVSGLGLDEWLSEFHAAHRRHLGLGRSKSNISLGFRYGIPTEGHGIPTRMDGHGIPTTEGHGIPTERHGIPTEGHGIPTRMDGHGIPTTVGHGIPTTVGHGLLYPKILKP
jgi:hypothetical protein